MYLAYQLELKEGVQQSEVPLSLFTGDIEYKYHLMFRSMPVSESVIKIQFFTIISDRYEFKPVQMPYELRKTFEKWFDVKQINWYEKG